MTASYPPIPCASCGGSLRRHRRYEFASAAFRRIYGDPNVYACSGCDLVQVDTAAVDDAALGRYYEHDYRAVAKLGIAPDEAGHRWYRARGVALADLAQRHAARTPARAFELGAGYGYNLDSLREVFPGLATFTDEADRNIRFHEAIGRANLADGPWDMVILSHVLEHFSDPVGLLQSAVDQLVAGGLLVIEVPNDRAGIIPINGPDEPHLTFFTESTLRQLLERVSRYELVEIFTAGPLNTPRSAATMMRRRLLGAAMQTPGLRRLASARRSGQAAHLDFRQPTPDGVFLRAVLRRIGC